MLQPSARPCLVHGAAHTSCTSLLGAQSCTHPAHVPAWCTELHSPCPGAAMTGMVLAGSFHWKGQKKQQVLGAGEASRAVKAASTPRGCGHRPADGEKGWGWPGPREEIIPLGFQHRKGFPPKCHFEWDLPSHPPGTPLPHVPSRFPGLPTSLPAAVTSHNIFGSSCRRRGDAWPSPRSRPRNAEQTSPPTPGISDVPAHRRFGTATAALLSWGHGRACPFNPVPASR